MDETRTLQDIQIPMILTTTDSQNLTIQGLREYRIVLAASWDHAGRLLYPHGWWTGRLAKARMIGPRLTAANP